MRTQLLSFATVCILLAGCSPGVDQIQPRVEMPEGLKDCKFYRVKPETGLTVLNVVRCPLSTTSVNYTSGKSTKSVITTESGPAGVLEEDVQRAVREAHLAKINAEIARLQLRAAELEREGLK